MTISITKVMAVTDVTGPRCRARAKKTVPITPWTTIVQTSGWPSRREVDGVGTDPAGRDRDTGEASPAAEASTSADRVVGSGSRSPARPTAIGSTTLARIRW